MEGTYNGEQNLPIIINNVEYRSSGEASKILGIPMATIRWRVLSKNPKYKNYHYVGQMKESFTNDEFSERLSKPQIGKQRNFNRPFLIDDIEYRTLKDASESLKISIPTIKGRLLNENFKNYKYKYLILSLDERVEFIMKDPSFDVLEFGIGSQVTEKHCHKICDLYNIPREKLNNVT
jgi:hypothetical protein